MDDIDIDLLMLQIKLFIELIFLLDLNEIPINRISKTQHM